MWKIGVLAETFGLKHGIGCMFFFWFGRFNMTQVLAWDHHTRGPDADAGAGARRLRPARAPGVCMAGIHCALIVHPRHPSFPQ